MFTRTGAKPGSAFPDTSLMLTLFEKNFDGKIIYQAEENPNGLTKLIKRSRHIGSTRHNLLEKVTNGAR